MTSRSRTYKIILRKHQKKTKGFSVNHTYSLYSNISMWPKMSLTDLWFYINNDLHLCVSAPPLLHRLSSCSPSVRHQTSSSEVFLLYFSVLPPPVSPPLLSIPLTSKESHVRLASFRLTISKPDVGASLTDVIPVEL